MRLAGTPVEAQQQRLLAGCSSGFERMLGGTRTWQSSPCAIPHCCAVLLQALATKCMSADPNLRPTFTEITAALLQLQRDLVSS